MLLIAQVPQALGVAARNHQRMPTVARGEIQKRHRVVVLQQPMRPHPPATISQKTHSLTGAVYGRPPDPQHRNGGSRLIYRAS
jgi:hypothetical protein